MTALPLRLLGLAGSLRPASTNRALLAGLAAVAPASVRLDLPELIASLPPFVFDPAAPDPAPVRALKAAVAAADGVVFAVPEYARALPGAFKNALDWLVPGDELIGKPLYIAHASLRGDDMLATLRTVLATLSERFSEAIFLRLPLATLAPAEIAARLDGPDRAAAEAFLAAIAADIRREETP